MKFPRFVLIAVLATGSAFAKNIPQPSFTREDCAERLLNPDASFLADELRGSVKFLEGPRWVPMNGREIEVRREDTDFHYAAYLLGPDATEEELAAVQKGIERRLKAAAKQRDAGYEAESTPLSSHQVKALGVHTPYPDASHNLTTTVNVMENGRLRILTRHQEREIGAFDVELKDAKFGVSGDIHLWTYLKATDPSRRKEKRGVVQFIAENQIVALPYRADGQRFALVFQMPELDVLPDSGYLPIDIYSVRECPATVAIGNKIFVPTPDPKYGLCFASTGLRLLNFFEVNDEDIEHLAASRSR